MANENSSSIFRRMVGTAIIFQSAAVVVTYIFTKSLIYCIIVIFATLFGISGFLVMIKLVDRFLKRGRGRILLFAAGGLKIAIIAAFFYPIARISESAILFYLLGLSSMVIAALVEGIYQMIRSGNNGRT